MPCCSDRIACVEQSRKRERAPGEKQGMGLFMRDVRFVHGSPRRHAPALGTNRVGTAERGSARTMRHRHVACQMKNSTPRRPCRMAHSVVGTGTCEVPTR